MYYNFIVNVPKEQGKIITKPKGDAYILFSISMDRYNKPDKKVRYSTQNHYR